MPEVGGRGMLEDLTEEAAVLGASRPSIYHRESNPSNDSLDSEALLDHREQPMMRPRRESRAGIFGTSHRALLAGAGSSSYRQENGSRQRRNTRTRTDSSRRLDADEDADDRTPLIGAPFQQESPTEGYGLFKPRSRQRRGSHSTTSSRPKGFSRSTSFPPLEQEYDVNNPPSVPPSPQLGEYGGVDDVMVPAGEYLTRSPDSQRNLAGRSRDALIDMEGNGADDLIGISAPPSPRLHPEGVQRRRTIGLPTSDVCFPTTTMSELADEDFDHLGQRTTHETRRRRRRRGYPQLWVLDEWSREEKEARMGGIRAKKIAEPVLVEGRLRPSKADWHREEEDVPFRYTYFNEDLESTIHAQTISELLQPGQTFRNLFIPDPIELSDTDSDTEPEGPPDIKEAVDPNLLSPKSQNGDLGHPPNYLDSSIANMKLLSGTSSGKGSKQESGADTPAQPASPVPNTPKPKRYGRRPAFWLDVMCPTNQEMQTLCKTFGIHALTAEDIMMQEAREKVELFRHYYFLNYRTFEQDIGHEEYMEPLNMYVIVFEGGVISFHWTQIPHPANVRRRIRQLTDYLELSPDWIAYAIIDDITDVYQPLINTCESEVDAVDEQILQLFEKTAALANKAHPDEKASVASKEKKSSFDLLLRVGETRKKVMSLYRLLSTKADVIKGFAKRCNEDFSVAPRSEIGLYLGDIQDHILTMVGLKFFPFLTESANMSRRLVL